MAKRISDETRIKQKRGSGHGKNYKPWILPRELKSLSTTSAYFDSRVGRQISLLSEGEKMVYLALAWRDDVSEIREQFPLDLSDTISIARYYGIRHPMFAGKNIIMTSDFLVDFIDGTQKVYSVKSNYESIIDERTAEKIFVEKRYWESKGVEYVMIFKDSDVNAVYARNIRTVMAYYDLKVFDSIESAIMYLIAHKIIQIDMTLDPLPIQQLKEFLLKKPKYLNMIA